MDNNMPRTISYPSTDSSSSDVDYDKVPRSRIDLNLWDHKYSIAITWTILFVSSGVLPVALYFALRYGANLQLSTVLAVTTAIFGAVSLVSLMQRFWRLLKQSSDCRPLGASRLALDFFQWNFLFGFVGVTAVTVAGNIIPNIRVVALGLPLLLADVCAQLLLASVLGYMRAPSPFRISSVARGEKVRSGAYTIAEDVVAVDGGQGQTFRRQLQNRYLSSMAIRQLCFRLDLIWGVSGLATAAVCFGLIFGLKNADVAYVLGWIVPWVYAAVMALVTIRMTSRAASIEDDEL